MNAEIDREADFYFANYWAVDIPGLDEMQANALVSLCKDRYDLHGSVTDPRLWLTLHLDRSTVEVLRAGLARTPGEIALAMREALEEWLQAVDGLSANPSGDS